MPLTKLRTSNLLSGSVDSGSLGPGSITGQVEASTVEDADLVLIYDNDATALRKMTRANFTAGLSTTLSGAYDAGTFITASKGPVDIQGTNNADAATNLLKLGVSGSVTGGGNAGPQILFTIPVSGESKVGAAIRGNKFASSESDSTSELNFSTSANNETLIRILKLDHIGAAVHGAGASEVYPSSGYAFMVAASGESSAVSVVNSNGNVGIGIQNAQNPLHVYKSNTSTEPFLEIENASSGDAALMFSISGDSYAAGIDNNDGDKFKISYASSAGGARLGANDWLTITPDGKVGLSQAVPEAQFEIQNTSLDPADDFGDPANYHMLIRGSSTTNDYMGIALGSSGQAGAAILHQDLGSYSKGDLIFMTKESTSNGAAPVERMRIKSDGETVLSASQFKITSTGDASIFIEADTDNATETDNPFLKMSQDGGLVASIIGHCGATDKDPENNTYTGAVSNNLLIGTLDSNGGVQIGTNDNVRITVESDGDVLLVSTKDDTTSSSANLFINSSTGFLARSTSDRRQKKDITAISSSLDDLCRLSPRHFYDVNDENNEVRIAGFVADEVQTVFPELVPERDLPDEIYRSVAYDRLGAYIVSAIKEIKQRLEALENGE